LKSKNDKTETFKYTMGLKLLDPDSLAKMEEYKNPEFKVKVCFKIGCDDPKCRSTNRESNSLCSEC
jgi:hypothetical protein